MDDTIVPPSMIDFVHRVLPGAAVHKLPYEGHFTYFYFCDECHRQIFTTLFGTPRGPLSIPVEEVDDHEISNESGTEEPQETTLNEDHTEEPEETTQGSTITD